MRPGATVILICLFLLFFQYAGAQDVCASAPTEALRTICRQIQTMDADMNTTTPKVQTTAAGRTMVLPPQNSAYQCQNISCICGYIAGRFSNGQCTLQNGQVYRKAVRKEWRMLSEAERMAYVRAFLEITNNGKYKELSEIHHQMATVSPGAHSGPAFLPWHRELTKRLEIALREVDPSVTLPYWDSTLESALRNPGDSIIFSDEFFGTNQGTVTTGYFANWIGLGNSPTRRQFQQASRTPFTEQDIQSILSSPAAARLLAFSAQRNTCPNNGALLNNLELYHGMPHVFIGGDMFNPLTSTNDPLFWLHHSFVDLIWEQWRQAKQTRQQRENHYPADNLQCATEAHFGGTIMRPFTPLINKDGLSNSYTDNLYEYAPRPGCSAQQDCGSELLFCDRSNGAPRCASKVKIGASCGGYRMGENPCYRGECLNGICQRSSQPNPGPAPTTGRPDVPTTTRRTWPTRPPWNGGSPTHIEPGYGCGVHVEPGYGSGPHVEPGYRNPDSPVYVEPGLDPITYPPSNQNPYLAFQRGK